MYRRPKFLEILLEIREEMSREAEYDLELFAQMLRSESTLPQENLHSLNGTGEERRDDKKNEFIVRTELEIKKND